MTLKWIAGELHLGAWTTFRGVRRLPCGQPTQKKSPGALTRSRAGDTDLYDAMSERLLTKLEPDNVPDVSCFNSFRSSFTSFLSP